MDLLGLRSLQDWQVQMLQSLHQPTLESKDLAILDSKRDISMHVFKDMIFKASYEEQCFCLFHSPFNVSFHKINLKRSIDIDDLPHKPLLKPVVQLNPFVTP